MQLVMGVLVAIVYMYEELEKEKFIIIIPLSQLAVVGALTPSGHMPAKCTSLIVTTA